MSDSPPQRLRDAGGVVHAGGYLDDLDFIENVEEDGGITYMHFTLCEERFYARDLVDQPLLWEHDDLKRARSDARVTCVACLAGEAPQ